MRMLIRRASATSNIIDVPISELAEYGEDDSRSDDETFTLLQSMFKGGSPLFKDQVCTLSQWFGQWSDCEQTVALYTLLRQLDSKQARFIENLLQEQASTDSSVDDLENQANDLEFVQSMSSKSKPEDLVRLLLSHFPLLHPGNEKVKDEYLKIIPEVLSNSVENSCKVEDCRKLLTYTLIHPAVSNDERSQFTKWLTQLERQYSMKITQTQQSHSNIQNLSSYAEQIDSTLSPLCNNNLPKDGSVFEAELPYKRIPLHATNSAPPYGTGMTVVTNNNHHKKLSRTSSSSHPRKSSNDYNGSSSGQWRSQSSGLHQNVGGWVIGQGSPAPSEHGPLSPQSSVSSTDSDHDGVVFYQENSGMKEFPSWLKSLRLHKYSPLFANVSYEEMLQVDDDWLEAKKVTKGARNKLVQSVSKLRERASELHNMEQQVVQGSNLKQVLTDLKAIVWSPMKPYVQPEGSASTSDIPEEDLASLVNRLMGKLCTQLLVNSRVDDECYPLYIQLIDKCLHHEAFTVKQTKLLQVWRSQVLQRNNGRMLAGRHGDQRQPTHKQTSRTNSWNPRRGSKGSGNALYAQRALQGQGHWTGPEKKPLTITYSGPDPSGGTQNLNNLNKPPMTKSAIHRTHSAPIRAAHPALHKKSTVTEPEINERLDSLARSMTEAALSSQDSIDHGDADNAAEER